MPLNKDVEGMLNPVLAAFDTKLKSDISGQLAEINISGQAEMIAWGKTKGGIPITYEGPPISQAIDWAEKHGAQLVTQMNEETKRRLAHTISQGIENKRGIPGLSRDIRNTFTDMSKHRSELIARTETANALSQSSLDTMKDMGIEGKEWVTAGDDLVSDECLANEDQGIIPADKAFTSGTMAPPQHPDCRCVVSPARLKPKPGELTKPPVAKPAEPPVKPKPTTPEPKVTKTPEPVGTKAQTGMDARTQKEYDKALRNLKKEDLDAMKGFMNDPSHSPVVGTREEIAKYAKSRKLAVKKGKGWDGYYDPRANQSYIVSGLETTSETIVHELGHQYYFNVMKPYTLRTKDFSRFNKVNNLFANAEKTRKVVSGYSLTAPEEYFAEGFMHFVKAPMKLKKLDPGLFDYFNKDIFKGAIG